ncbi:MAG: GlxA family transcriptional regulator [Corynebacterium sp.]|uniref:GlxA family transcriptional regulator n=1 Tax=Corynebacterium sp. TaxID=1720 RepID=UPI0026E003FC|nr:GlxA family transcriptional regulator [Corynebacterium sp.]MDO5669443.1 GlxA family transcriptional regulator [Corynebacterium sp.]
MKRVGFLVFEGVTMLDVTGPAEVLSRAGIYELILFSPTGAPVTASTGLPVTGTHPPLIDAALDTVIIPGSDSLADHPFDAAHLAAARILTTGPRRVASVCTGAFLLAELGLLDGRRATTHWRNAADLARRYPRVRVEPDTLHVHDGRYLTSAGISAGIDLALSLVEEDLDAAAARRIAQEMVMFMHRPGGQSQFASGVNTPSVQHPILREVMRLVEDSPAEPHSIATLAARAAVSERHLTRLFRAELGVTPARWLEQARLSTAQQLLLDGHTVTAAASRSGFGSDESLRRAFDRRLHTTPSEYRARFRSTFRAR